MALRGKLVLIVQMKCDGMVWDLPRHRAQSC